LRPGAAQRGQIAQPDTRNRGINRLADERFDPLRLGRQRALRVGGEAAERIEEDASLVEAPAPAIIPSTRNT